MTTLDTITKREADKLFLGDIANNLIVATMFQGSTVSGSIILAQNPEKLSSKLIGAACLGFGLLNTSLTMVEVYNSARKYIKDPSAYMRREHSKEIEYMG